MKKIFKRIGLFLTEVLNILLNVLVPIVSVVAAILELFPIPTKYIKSIKQAEYWLFYAAGTLKKVDKIIDDKEKELTVLEEKTEDKE